jgi:hypothetical protein
MKQKRIMFAILIAFFLAIAMTIAPAFAMIINEGGSTRTHSGYDVTLLTQTTYKLQIKSASHGETSPDSGTYHYGYGTIVNVTAIPDTEYYFDRWFVKALGWTSENTNNPIQLHITTDIELTPNFEKIPTYKLTINIHQTGDGTVNCTEGYYLENTVLTILATPNNGYEFDHFEFEGKKTTDNPITINMTNPENLEVWFEEIQIIPKYSLTITTQGNGITNPTVGVYLYDAGDIATVTAIPDSGNYFKRWVLDGNYVSNTTNPISIEMCNPQEQCSNHTLEAVFCEIPIPPPPPKYYTLTVTVEACDGTQSGFGTADPIGVHSYVEGTEITVTAYPSEGWYFDHWVIDSYGIATINPADITMIHDISVIAVFNPIPIPPPQYTISVTMVICSLDMRYANTFSMIYTGDVPSSVSFQLPSDVYNRIVQIYGTDTFTVTGTLRQDVSTQVQYSDGSNRYYTTIHELGIRVNGVPSITVTFTP